MAWKVGMRIMNICRSAVGNWMVEPSVRFRAHGGRNIDIPQEDKCLRTAKSTVITHGMDG